MATKSDPKKMEVPDVSDLLSKIGDSRNALPKSPLQEVKPVEAITADTPIRQNVKTSKASAPVNVGGKPTNKMPEVAYVRLSPRIPAVLKEELDIALIRRKFTDDRGQPIRYIDEFVAEAVRRMLAAN